MAIGRRGRRGIAAIGLGLVVTVIGAGVSWALWVDTAPVSGAQLHSGTVVLRANGSAAATIPAVITPQLAASTTVNVPVTISNAGTLPLDYRLDDVTATGSVPSLYTSGLTIRIGLATSAASCSAGSTGPQIALTTGSVLLGAAFVVRRTLAASAAEVLCVSLTAPAVTSAAFRDGTADVTLHFHGQSQ